MYFLQAGQTVLRNLAIALHDLMLFADVLLDSAVKSKHGNLQSSEETAREVTLISFCDNPLHAGVGMHHGISDILLDVEGSATERHLIVPCGNLGWLHVTHIFFTS